MMSPLTRGLTTAVLILALSGMASSAMAQSDPRLVDAVRAAQEGRGDSARTTVDRLLAATPQTDTLYPQILYTQAMVAGTAGDMRRLLQRVTVEYGTSSWADDALLRLVQMDYATRNFDGAAGTSSGSSSTSRPRRCCHRRPTGRGGPTSTPTTRRPRAAGWRTGWRRRETTSSCRTSSATSTSVATSAPTRARRRRRRTRLAPTRSDEYRLARRPARPRRRVRLQRVRLHRVHRPQVRPRPPRLRPAPRRVPRRCPPSLRAS